MRKSILFISTLFNFYVYQFIYVNVYIQFCFSMENVGTFSPCIVFCMVNYIVFDKSIVKICKGADFQLETNKMKENYVLVYKYIKAPKIKY